jgi:hypothetical protein
MKLARLTDSRFHQALRKLSSQPLPLRVAFRLKGIASKADIELKKFEECRQAALEKYGKHDDEGTLLTREDGSVEFEAEQLSAFAAELNDLGQLDVDLGFVKMDELGDKVELTVEEISALDDLIVE